MTKSQFIEKIGTIVVSENKKRGYPLFSSVVIAQACLETGYGNSEIMMKANAVFGIKATKTWGGKVYNSKTKECYDGISMTTISSSFRAYNNLQDSISDYFDLICKSTRYRKACTTNTPLECITAIKNGGYATDPKYITSIMNIIKQNNLTKYDIKEEIKNQYQVNKVYTLQTNLNVRNGAGTNYKNKKYSELTSDGRKHALNQVNAVLKRGTKVTCKRVIQKNSEVWLQIPSGYVCAIYNERVYIK